MRNSLDAMRTFEVRTSCNLPARRLWELRQDFEIERAFAQNEGRTLTRLQPDATIVGLDGSPRTRRRVLAELPSNAVPKAFARWVTVDDLRSETTSTWSPEHRDREHACVTLVEFPRFGDAVEIRFVQHVEGDGDASCVLCTQCHVKIKVDGVPNWVLETIERVVEGQFRGAFGTFVKQAEAHEVRKAHKARETRAEDKAHEASETIVAEPAAAREDEGESDDAFDGFEDGEVTSGCCSFRLRFRCVVCGVLHIVCGKTPPPRMRRVSQK